MVPNVHFIACVVGVIGEGDGKGGRREKTRGDCYLPPSSPSPITPATQAMHFIASGLDNFFSVAICPAAGHGLK